MREQIRNVPVQCNFDVGWMNTDARTAGRPPSAMVLREKATIDKPGGLHLVNHQGAKTGLRCHAERRVRKGSRGRWRRSPATECLCVCVTISLVWVRPRPKKLWKLDDPVSQVSFFAHSGFEKQTSSVGSHAVVLW